MNLRYLTVYHEITKNPLMRILSEMLEKAPEDKIVSLTKEQKTLRVMQRMISPPWTAGLMKKNLAFAEEIANEKPVYFLRCTKNDTAAEVMHHRITEDELAQEALK